MKKKWMLLVFLALAGCHTTEPGASSNPNIIALPNDDYSLTHGDFHTVVWVGDKVYGAVPIVTIQLNSDLSVIKDTLISHHAPVIYVTANRVGSTLMFVETKYANTSVGALFRFDISTGKETLLLDSSNNVSTAQFLSDTEAIYYSYGKPYGNGAGYYQINFITGKKRLLLNHVSELGSDEMLNGFDIHPDGTKMVIPINRSQQSPTIIEFNLLTHLVDTLHFLFDTLGEGHVGLWLRYSNSGDKLVYSNYTLGALNSSTYNDSELGILDLIAHTKRILNANPRPGVGMACVCANWSPDDTHIVYGAGPIANTGEVGEASLYILRNINP